MRVADGQSTPGCLGSSILETAERARYSIATMIDKTWFQNERDLLRPLGAIYAFDREKVADG